MSTSVSRKAAAQSYRPKGFGMSAGLLRARQMFRLPNAITGLGLGLFAAAVWGYSISAVKQENFDDIDEEARKLASTHSEASRSQVKGRAEVDKEMLAVSQPSGPSIDASHPPDPKPSEKIPRGLLPALLPSRMLDPSSQTLIWGAPPVDNMGRLRDRTK